MHTFCFNLTEFIPLVNLSVFMNAKKSDWLMCVLTLLKKNPAPPREIRDQCVSVMLLNGNHGDSSRRLTSGLDLLFNYCTLLPVGMAS